MCDTIRGWRQDPEAEGEHNLVPVSCTEYIEELENLLSRLMLSNAESMKMVTDIVSHRSERETAQAAWLGKD